MNRKLKPSLPYITNDRPAILGGARMTPFELPPDFDLTLHRKILASGKVRATTQAEFAEMIAKLEQQLATECQG
jgi:hypothetical protein